MDNINLQASRPLTPDELQLANACAQAGANAVWRRLIEQGRLLPEGKPMLVRNVVRNEKGQITAVIEEQVMAREPSRTTESVVPTLGGLWNGHHR